MYAVIMSGGKQYRVAKGDRVRLERLDADSGSQVEFKDVLLVKTEDRSDIGQPVVQGAVVRGVVEANGKGDKVLVLKYKRKKQYRRTRGHRQDYSEVRIEEISIV